MLIPTIRPPARGVLPSSIGFKNAVCMNPGDNLITKYNWLKSSNRDGQMGALSATNRRTLILTPGKYILTAELELDTDYVDITGVSGHATDSIITRGTGGSAVNQSASDVKLSNFTIETTGEGSGTDFGFEITASDNTPSFYQNMHFIGTSTSAKKGFPVFGTNDLGGTWINCHATGWAWRVAANKKLKAKMFDCISWFDEIGQYSSAFSTWYGYQSFGGDTAGADCSGLFVRCITGYGGFGGCGTWGCNCSGTFIDCMSGSNSWALQRQFTGLAIRCIAGLQSFAAGSTYDGVNAKFAGQCIDCVVSGKGVDGLDKYLGENYKSLGMGGGSSKGICGNAKIINCRYGYDSEYARGISKACSNLIAIDGEQATHTTAFTGGDNSNITMTAKTIGKDGNQISFKVFNVPPGWSVSLSGKQISVKKTTGLQKTATELQALLEGNGDVAALITVTQIGDGSGYIDDIHSEKFFEGGADRPQIKGNHPIMPAKCTADTTVYAFDNGHSYTNEEATGDITLSLPPAIPGFEYRFIVMATYQLRIDPYGSETIAINGTQQDAGKHIWADAAGESCLLKCVKAGQWEQFDALGTWTAEA